MIYTKKLIYSKPKIIHQDLDLKIIKNKQTYEDFKKEDPSKEIIKIDKILKFTIGEFKKYKTSSRPFRNNKKREVSFHESDLVFEKLDEVAEKII